MRRAARLALLTGGLILAAGGCRTAPPMAPIDLAGGGWTVLRGQALWQPGSDAPELAGTLLMASDAGGAEFIRFSKDPVDIVLAQRSPEGWSLRIPAFNKDYSGRSHAPRRVVWFQLADAVFGDGCASGWHWSGVQEGRWTLSHARTGERLEGFFSP